jgi:hypothetical protein
MFRFPINPESSCSFTIRRSMMKTAQKSATMAMLVPESELERFVDESIEIERALRTLATRP